MMEAINQAIHERDQADNQRPSAASTYASSLFEKVFSKDDPKLNAAYSLFMHDTHQPGYPTEGSDAKLLGFADMLIVHGAEADYKALNQKLETDLTLVLRSGFPSVIIEDASCKK